MTIAAGKPRSARSRHDPAAAVGPGRATNATHPTRSAASGRAGVVADIAARRSDATVTATPSSRAAVRKSGAR